MAPAGHSREGLPRHSREGGNPQLPRTRGEFNEKKHPPDRPATAFPHRTSSTSELPQRHSREGGNPQLPRTREFNEKKHPPDRPATAFPHRTSSTSELPQRHSREGGNPQLPRTREFNEKKHPPDRPATAFPHRISSTSELPQRHSREGGNPQIPRMREFPRSHAPAWECIPVSPPITVPKRSAGFHAGAGNQKTYYSRAGLLHHSRLRGNDGVFLSGIG